MTPCLNSIVVMDWVEAIGGAHLVEHFHRVYRKYLETVTLGSLQSRISKNLDSLIHEVEKEHQQNTHINRVASFSPTQRSGNHAGPQRRFPTGPPKLPFPGHPAFPSLPIQKTRTTEP